MTCRHLPTPCERASIAVLSGCDTLPENRQKVRLKMRHLKQVSQTRWRRWSNTAKRALRQAALVPYAAKPQGVANWRLFDLFCATAPLAPPPLGVWGGGANSGSHHRHHQDTRALHTACRRLRLARHAHALSHRRPRRDMPHGMHRDRPALARNRTSTGHASHPKHANPDRPPPAKPKETAERCATEGIGR